MLRLSEKSPPISFANGVTMGSYDFKDLERHLGHDIECVAYGSEGVVWNVAVECTTCNEVILDFDKEE